MNKFSLFVIPAVILLLTLPACNKDNGTTDTDNSDCTSPVEVDTSRGECTETLSFNPEFNMDISNDVRVISANNIPDHKVGLFGNAPGSLNPNAVQEQNSTYNVDATPSLSGTVTQLLGNDGPSYSFGVLLNGVELDPVAAEPWPHEGIMSPNVNWEWNLEATMVSIGLDCNNAHVQPTGKYHYHANPTLYLESINASSIEMTMIGYAADGFPIYYQYGYVNSDDNTSSVKELKSSYRLKEGQRSGDGVSAPCGEYTGVYSADFEYVDGLGDLDECNGRTGVTPEFPEGTYYYVITEDFPNIPRCFKGTPSQDFKVGP